ncbi:Regulator of Vps4 activity in the MVB pathway protein [Euphorbia peplus]|nr:Regulator of Vps4 activity in the MVB pathway protein [Euphorbia peplus]
MDGCLDGVLGRKFKASKFKTLAKLAISRASVLKKQRQVRYSNAKSDTIELLKLGQHERALLRAEHMVKEQNMMDAFVMIEEYCYLLIDRIIMLKKDRECNEEVKEAIASLIFASSRCGEFPELQAFRRIFASKYGREFATRAVELRNNCGVNPKMIQKLSSQRPSLESRMKVLKDVASENGIILDLVEHAPLLPQEKSDDIQKQKQKQKQKQEKEECYTLAIVEHHVHNDDDDDKVWAQKLSRSDEMAKAKAIKARKEYKDFGDAALEAFESAAYAAAAARAAVLLSSSLSLQDHSHHN